MKKLLSKTLFRGSLVVVFLLVIWALASKFSPCKENVAYAEGEYRLPWPICTTVQITQGNKSQGPSHFQGSSMEYAVDFALNEGDPVAAVREGTVLHFEGTMTECGGKEFASKANYIVIDHGDGTSALYLHLKSTSVKKIGEPISRGQIIGLAGKTGWTYCNAHLHFQLQKTGGWWEQSLPISFFETPSDKLNSGTSVHSQNFLVKNSLSSEGWIAFENKNNIWLIHPDGSGVAQITNNDSDSPRVIEFKWSPDGKTLAYSLSTPSGNAIFLYDIQTSTAKLLTNDDVGDGFDWSLTSKQIMFDDPLKSGLGLFDSQNRGFWVINLEDGNKRRIIKTSKDVPAIIEPQWSPEGSHVIFSYPGGFEAGGFGVTEISVGKFTTILPSGNDAFGGCNWSSNDLIIACIRYGDENGNQKPIVVALLDVDGNLIKEFPLPSGTTFPWIGPWSPDGKKIAIGYAGGTISNIQNMTNILSLDTGTFQTLASGIISDWSPDGQWILTWESKNAASPTISVVNINSGETLSLSEGQDAIWQP